MHESAPRLLKSPNTPPTIEHEVATHGDLEAYLAESGTDPLGKENEPWRSTRLTA